MLRSDAHPAPAGRQVRRRRRCRHVAAPCGRSDRRLGTAVAQRVVACGIEPGFGQIAESRAATARRRWRRRTGRRARTRRSAYRCRRPAVAIARPAACRRPPAPQPYEDAAPPSEKSSRAQAQVTRPPSAAPKPRSRSSRTAPVGDSRPASCATWRRCGSAGPKFRDASAAALAAPNTPAPTGLAHRMRAPSSRPQPRRQGARRMNGQPWIAHALQLEIGAVHGHRTFDVFWLLPGAIGHARQPNSRQYRVRHRQGPRLPLRNPAKARITLIRPAVMDLRGPRYV